MSDLKAHSSRFAVGADIGGTHITSALVDLEKRIILPNSDFHQKVDASEWPSTVIPAWGEILKKSMETVPQNELAGIGLAMPGPFDYKNGVSQITGLTKYERLFGLNVKHALSQYLGLEMGAIRLMNDANCFLFGESWLTEKQYNRIIGITLGTGFGAAFFKGGQIVEAGVGVPPNSEFFPIPFRGATAEDHISSRGILKLYKEKTNQQLSGVKDVADLALNGDPIALEVLESFGTTLGAFLGPWLIEFGAEAIIIGGNISRAHRFFLSGLKASLKQQGVEVDVIISQLLDQAGILGAGRLFAPTPSTTKTPTASAIPSREFIISEGAGTPSKSIGEFLAAMIYEKKAVLHGSEHLNWEALRTQLVEGSPFSSLLLYETSPNSMNDIPGYALEKILPDPNNEVCLLIGNKADNVNWKANHYLVSEV